VGDISVRESSAVRTAIDLLLCDRYGIRHATLQMECETCQPDTLYCNLEDGTDSRGQGKADE
jgi:cobalt-zinc-cadmium efflux system protein